MIVGAAVIRGGRVLACARAHPPDLVGRWEFPGGKVERGEAEQDALVRECAEELDVRIEVGDRLGVDVPIAGGRYLLKVWTARLVSGEPRPVEHAELRWLAAGELDTVDWLPADAPLVKALLPLLR